VIATKWPRLLVVGLPVTEEQADLILVRTTHLPPFTNDKAWERVITTALADVGAPPEPAYTAGSDVRLAWYRAFREWEQRAGILSLGYLHNDRIASAWIGGPHGWCDWDGTIGCGTSNIGKWPSTEEVTDDWAAIARAFPFLDLTAQLLEDEGEGQLCGQWRVRGGQVEYDDAPAEQIRPAAELGEADVIGRFTRPDAERGVSETRLRQALARVTAAAVQREDGESA